MHATIQKPLDEIISHLRPGERVFVVGCGNCAAKARSGGEPEVRAMKQRLEARGITVTGWAVPPDGGSLCKMETARRLLSEEHGQEVAAADSVLVLACGQGVHTVLDATDGKVVHPGCDTIFGGETVTEDFITEHCCLCGQCILEQTGGLCPLALCAKGLLNGPCGGAQEGKCEVDRERDCGWHLIYERLRALGRMELMHQYVPPKDHLRRSSPRSLSLEGRRADFRFAGKTVSAWSGED